MHRLLLVGLFFLAGCQGVVGPVRRTCITEPIDNPCLSIPEQQQRERDRLALPERSPTVGPNTYAGNPALRGP
jgi:hypothetical protein